MNLKTVLYNELLSVFAGIDDTKKLAHLYAKMAELSIPLIDFDGPAIKVWDNILSLAEKENKIVPLASQFFKDFPENTIVSDIYNKILDKEAYVTLGRSTYVNNRAQKITIYAIYNPIDLKYWNGLEAQLKVFKISRNIEILNMNVQGGENISDVQLKNLETSNILLLLISKDFFSDSPDCIGLARQGILQKKLVIPVLLEDCAWARISIIQDIQVLPRDLRPLSKWSPRSTGTFKVAEEVGRVLDNWKFS